MAAISLGRQRGPARASRADCQLRRPDRLRIVFDHARGGQDLRKLLLRRGDDPAGVIENDRPAGRGALIEGKDEFGHGLHAIKGSQGPGGKWIGRRVSEFP